MLMKYSSLKEKDLEYMKFILRHGMVTAKHVFLNFKEKNMDTVYRRLRKLRDKGLLNHDMSQFKTGVYMSTEDARNITEWPSTVPERATVYTMRHSLLMVDLTMYFQLLFEKQGKSFSYQTEREMRYEALKGVRPGKQKIAELNKMRERFPDCAFYIDGQKYWIELELNQKENKRYVEKFKERFEPLLTNGEYAQVWYFTDSKRIETAVQKAREEVINGEKKIKTYDFPSVVKTDNWEEML